jgi:hypothetical protein
MRRDPLVGSASFVLTQPSTLFLVHFVLLKVFWFLVATLEQLV